MSADFKATDRAPGAHGSGFSGVLLEAGVVALVGVALAFLANAVSPRGLALGQDYFPRANRGPRAAVTVTNVEQVTAVTPSTGGAEGDPVAARLAEQNLVMADLARTLELFRDPRFGQGKIVFVDARNDELYQAGHIPGAYQLDYYRAANYLGQVLPACLTAERVLVYCIGRECEDSEFAAILLRQAGVANEKLLVYPEGFTEWSARQLPVATGPQRGMPEVTP